MPGMKTLAGLENESSQTGADVDAKYVSAKMIPNLKSYEEQA